MIVGSTTKIWTSTMTTAAVWLRSSAPTAVPRAAASPE
jgi:hypothetical protein